MKERVSVSNTPICIDIYKHLNSDNSFQKLTRRNIKEKCVGRAQEIINLSFQCWVSFDDVQYQVWDQILTDIYALVYILFLGQTMSLLGNTHRLINKINVRVTEYQTQKCCILILYTI